MTLNPHDSDDLAPAREVEEPVFVEEIQEALVVRPGDKLLVRVHAAALPEDVTDLLDKLKERFPEVEITVVAADQLAVVRDG